MHFKSPATTLQIFDHFIWFNVQCVRKLAVHLSKVLEFMSTKVYTCPTLSMFNEISQKTYELIWDDVQLFWGIFLATCSCTKSVYLLPSRKTYSTRKTRSSIERTISSKNWTNQLSTLPVLHFNRCITAEYSETKAHFNGNFDSDNQFYVPSQSAQLLSNKLYVYTVMSTEHMWHSTERIISTLYFLLICEVFVIAPWWWSATNVVVFGGIVTHWFGRLINTAGFAVWNQNSLPSSSLTHMCTGYSAQTCSAEYCYTKV
jgi:hypothetical protein